MVTEQEPTITSEILPPALAEILKPQETAIIVVDVMNAYFDQQETLAKLVHSGTTELDKTAKKISEFLDESRKYPIATHVFTRMVERPDAMPENYRYKMAEVDETPALVEVGGSGWNYYTVAPQEGDHEITKTHYNAFTDTNLHDHLQQKRVKTVVIIGGYGSRCVASTAIVAADVYGYNVFVPKDLVANLDSPEKQDPNWVDELPAFLQAHDIVWGYTPNSKAILNTWQQSSKTQ